MPGTTRQMIIDKSPITVHYGKLKISDVAGIDELLLTNSGSGVVPILKVDKNTIGDGTVGRITRELMDNYAGWLRDEFI